MIPCLHNIDTYHKTILLRATLQYVRTYVRQVTRLTAMYLKGFRCLKPHQKHTQKLDILIITDIWCVYKNINMYYDTVQKKLLYVPCSLA